MDEHSDLCDNREAILFTAFAKRNSQRTCEQRTQFGYTSFQERKRKSEGDTIQQNNVKLKQSDEHSLIAQNKKDEEKKKAFMVEQLKNPERQELDQLNQEVEQKYWLERVSSKRDISQLISDKELYQQIRFSIQNTKMFINGKKQVLLSYKAQIDQIKNFHPLSELIKPFLRIKEQIEALFPQQNSQIKQPSENNTIFKKYLDSRLEELQIEKNQQIANKKDFLYTNIPKEHPFFSQRWQDILDKYNQFISEQKILDKNTFEQEYLTEVNEDTPKCLNCQPLFFYGQKIFDQTVTKEKVVLAGPIKYISKNRQFIKEEIAGLMNSKGGIILFDIAERNFSFRTKGDILTNHQVFQIQKIVKQLLRQITPIPQILQETTLTFVPVAQKSKEKGSKYNFTSNLFVTKIIVKPTKSFEIYTFIREGSEVMTVRNKSIFNSPEYKHHLSGQALQQQRLKRLKMKEQFQNIPEDLKFYFSECQESSHQCEQSFRGTQDFRSKQIQKNPDKYFKQAVIVIINRKFRLILQKKFQKKGISCLVKFPFEHLNIKGAQSCAIIYFDLQYRQLIEKTATDKQFYFNGKPFLAAQILNYIKLKQPIQLNNLYTWVREECGMATVELIEYQNDIQKQFYIYCSHKTASVLIYLLFIHFGGKASFKEPNKGEGIQEDKFKILERCP